MGRKTNHCKLNQKAIEFIDGELLGDGCLYLCRYSAGFVYSLKYEEHTNYISNILNSFGIKQSGKIRKYKDKRYNNITYNYNSKSYAELLPLRQKWYPNSKKIIPKDIKLTSLTCKQWYIDDGSLIIVKNKNPYIRFSTCGFPISDVKWLVKQLNKLGFKATRRPSDNTIRISTISTQNFLDYIGHCPVKCYQYKWRSQYNELFRLTLE